MTLEALDYEQIRQRLAKLARAVDFGDDEGVGNCFTADGWMEIQGLPAEAPHAGKVQNTAALRAMHQTLFGATQGQVRHWVGNSIIEEISRGRVRTRSYVMVLRVGKVLEAGVLMTASYDDILVHDGEQWLIEGRICSSDPLPQHTRISPSDAYVVAFDQAAEALASLNANGVSTNG